MNIDIPSYIALVGNPTAGKTTAAEIMVELFGVKILETGFPLRKFAMDHLGLTYQQVYTQEGKLENVDIAGEIWPVRKILGDLGQKLEDMFGEEIMPFMAQQLVKNTKGHCYVDASCRKSQPHFWKRQGGIVIGIRNPLAPPSPFTFDAFDESAVDYWIDNDGLANGMSKDEAMKDLSEKVLSLFVNRTLAQAA